MGAMIEPLYEQWRFRVRDSVKDPVGVDAAFDAGDTATNTNWTQAVDELFRVRFVIRQTDIGVNVPDNLATELRLQWQNTTQATGWSSIFASMASQHVTAALATGFVDNDVTSTQLIGSGTQVDGEGLEVAALETGTIQFLLEALTQVELEVSLSIDSLEVNDGDLIELRWLWSLANESPPVTVLDNYDVTPVITVDKPAAGSAGPLVNRIPIASKVHGALA